MPRPAEPSLIAGFHDTKADYEAAKRSGRFVRRRRGVPASGAGADYHYASESDYLWMGEIARDMGRNDPVIGQLVDRAVANWIGSGFTPDPDTGDAGLDLALKDRWQEESEDPDRCDLAGELTFHEQEIMVAREMLVPGDVFGVFTDQGNTQLIESHRCRSPQRTARNIVHGIELDRITRQRLRAWFTKEPVNPLTAQSSIKVSDLKPYDFRFDDNECQVMHVYSPKRASQTRGVTALAPIITMAGMFDDLNFATLLKAQLSAFWLTVRKREASYFENNPHEQPVGTLNTNYGSGRRVENLAPGSELLSNPGETITPWQPNVPNAEFFAHAKLILTLIGINLGLPLVLTLLDASETNFSGYRGAIDQARLGFRHNQRILKARFHRPTWRFKLHYWADEDPTLARSRERLGERYLKHKWNTPGWPYIDPTKDAQSDLLRMAHMQSSPRRLMVERGAEWQEIVAETVTDRSLAISSAIAAAKNLNEQHSLEGNDMVSWRDLAPLPTPQGVTVALDGQDPPEPNAPTRNANPAA
jgi:capsid protein